MRPVLVSLLLALVAFSLVALLPAPVGMISLLRMLLCLVGALAVAAAFLASVRSLGAVVTEAVHARQH